MICPQPSLNLGHMGCSHGRVHDYSTLGSPHRCPGGRHPHRSSPARPRRSDRFFSAQRAGGRCRHPSAQCRTRRGRRPPSGAGRRPAVPARCPSCADDGDSLGDRAVARMASFAPTSASSSSASGPELETAVRKTGLLTAGRNPGAERPRLPTADERRQERRFHKGNYPLIQ